MGLLLCKDLEFRPALSRLAAWESYICVLSFSTTIFKLSIYPKTLCWMMQPSHSSNQE